MIQVQQKVTAVLPQFIIAPPSAGERLTGIIASLYSPKNCQEIQVPNQKYDIDGQTFSV